MEIEMIARIRTDFPEKFGIPRQSGLVPELTGEIVFEPKYRNPDALRGIEGFSHLWLIWGFSEVKREGWSATVRPPRLGGNTRMGVFATRSPFRPNPLGLSCVKLDGVEYDAVSGPVVRVSGVDMLDGTPIYDIKPYVPHADMRAEATGGFADAHRDDSVKVDFPEALLVMVPEEKREALLGILAGDPRPSYQDDPERVYGFGFAGFEVRFRVADGVLAVCDIIYK